MKWFVVACYGVFCSGVLLSCVLCFMVWCVEAWYGVLCWACYGLCFGVLWCGLSSDAKKNVFFALCFFLLKKMLFFLFKLMFIKKNYYKVYLIM